MLNINDVKSWFRQKVFQKIILDILFCKFVFFLLFGLYVVSVEKRHRRLHQLMQPPMLYVALFTRSKVNCQSPPIQYGTVYRCRQGLLSSCKRGALLRGHDHRCIFQFWMLTYRGVSLQGT